MTMREYELVLMLDPETPDERRDQIAAESRQRIEGKGSLKAEKAWGMRKLAYEISRRNEADYRYFRFETESPLLDELDHNLKITDGVLRFRIFKVDPTAPMIEPPPPTSLASSAPARGPGGPRRGAEEPAAAASAPPPAPAESLAPAESPAPPESPAPAESAPAAQSAGEAPATPAPGGESAPAEAAEETAPAE